MEQLKECQSSRNERSCSGDRNHCSGHPNRGGGGVLHTNKHFHPKADGKVGFIITLNKMRIYHTGDTDDIPEMSAIEPDIGLCTVSGTYVMTAEGQQSSKRKDKAKKLGNSHALWFNSRYRKKMQSNLSAVTACPVEILTKE